MPPFRITVLDETGVEVVEAADRETAWLIALAAQIDADRAAETRRFDDAYCHLWDAVRELEAGR